MDAPNTEALVALITDALGPRTIDRIPFAVVPAAYKIESLEHFKDRPARPRGIVKIKDVESFLAYWSRFVVEASVLFASGPEVKAPYFCAIFDYHVDGREAGWCEHQARFDCEFSSEWKTWMAKNGQHQDQTSFARFIEDNFIDIVRPEDEPHAPAAADILEIATQLEVHKTIRLTQGTRLNNGQHQLSYVEEIQGTTRSGTLTIPDRFFIAVAPFYHSTVEKIAVRLRYRDTEKGVFFCYELERPQDVVRKAYDQLTIKIHRETGAIIFQASID